LQGSYLSITVYIEDVNDNAPEFLNVPYVVDVDENTSIESIIFEGVQLSGWLSFIHWAWLLSFSQHATH